MGVSVSKRPIPSELKKQHRLAEHLIADARKKNQNVYKLLLLGPADAGKSTIIKQMPILHGLGFQEEELTNQRYTIYGNIILFGDHSSDRHLIFQADGEHVLKLDKLWPESQCIYPQDWECLKTLWADEDVQACYASFCDSLGRISRSDYTPTAQDMLHTCVNTIGIVELQFTMRGHEKTHVIIACQISPIKVIDVGGQRSQRKKWIHCFENINAFIYVAAISEYNQMLAENSTVNRLFESIKLFSMIVNSRWFAESSVVLFLNKKDLFEEKLKVFPLSDTFPRFKADSDYEQACAYVQRRFHRENKNAQKNV